MFHGVHGLNNYRERALHFLTSRVNSSSGPLNGSISLILDSISFLSARPKYGWLQTR
ncbi:hypothetical protein BC937DRAFT_88130 [Endogone sp. FLAS-F59071]|nr:hypothetical protein BC937DRAFT_88130 [Endogone sp. FLAS-F59071]|eukprot:RUS18962.1 hypothetical protein BC937DRAFT_88130 [Endogone sp. FLAS-F59071]